MMPLSTIWPLLPAEDVYRPRFFFKREWRWHELMMPLLLALAIEITSNGWLQITNTRQQKIIRMETTRSSLASLVTRCDLLSQETVGVETTDSYFNVRLPLGTG